MAIKVSNTTVIDNSRNLTNIGTIDAAGNATFSGTGYIQIPVGTEAQRPGTPSTGMLRFNSTTNKLEIYDGSKSTWAAAGGGGGASAGLTYFAASW